MFRFIALGLLALTVAACQADGSYSASTGSSSYSSNSGGSNY